MKNLNQYIKEYLIGDNTQVYKYFPKTKEELQEIIEQLIKERGDEANLNDIDTSKITDMSYLFNYKGLTNFDGDISEWNVSNVKDMGCMFWSSKFSGDISNWDVSKVEDMKYMFDYSPLEKNPPKWYKKRL